MEASVTTTREQRFERLIAATELPFALLALLIVPALVLEDSASRTIRELALAVNWFVWLALCCEYLIKLALAPDRARYVRAAWFEILIILLSPPFLVPHAMQEARALRAVRILRLLPLLRVAAVAALGLRLASDALRHRRFHYVALATSVIVGLGAIGIFEVERGTNSAITTLGDAFWWAVVTVTTVGYGDVSPVTGEGRLIAVVLMIVGIGFIGIFTATLTSFFFAQERSVESVEIEARLTRIEVKVDELLRVRTKEDS